VLVSGSSVTTAADSSVIVDGADWERSATGFQSATLVAIRGWIAFTPLTLASATWFSYIGMYDEDEASSLADVVATYQTETILWTHGGRQTSVIQAWTQGAVPVHVRAKRRLTNNMEIRLVRTANVTSIVQFTCLLRGLLELR